MTEHVICRAVIDAYTCVVCRRADGKRFPKGQAPVPHPDCEHVKAGGERKCRCTVEPDVTGAWDGGKVISRADMEAPPKRGGVPPTYSDWLKGLTAVEQDELLGPVRAAAYRSGDHSVFDIKGRTVSLADLAKDRG